MTGYFDLCPWNADKETEELNQSLFSSFGTKGEKSKKQKRKHGTTKAQSESPPKKAKLSSSPCSTSETEQDKNSKKQKRSKKRGLLASSDKHSSEKQGGEDHESTINPCEKGKPLRGEQKADANKKDGKKAKPENNCLSDQSQQGTSDNSSTKINKKKKRKKNKNKNKYAHLAGKPKPAGLSSPIKIQDSEMSSTPNPAETQVIKPNESADGKRTKSISQNRANGNTKESKESHSMQRLPVKQTKSSKIKLETIESSEVNPKTQSMVKKTQKKSKTGKPSSTLPFNVEKLKNVLKREQPMKSTDKHSKKAITEKKVHQEGDKKVKRQFSEKSADIQSVKQELKKPGVLSLRDKMKERLNAARFRYLNEQLYTIEGREAFQLFADDPSAFNVYHEGFQSQVTKWPQNPVQMVVDYVKKRPRSITIADFGCGDAKLAQSVPHKVHSFDLVAINKHVTPCDMSKVPLSSESVDIGVFCLALMGTNLTDFLTEANRVIKPGGHLLVAEVVSRFEKVGNFVRKMEKMGFSLLKKDTTNKMFIWFEFRKSAPSPPEHLRPKLELLPCTYKKR